MKWIDVRVKLPEKYEKVLVRIKYEYESEFGWTDSWLEDQESQKSCFAYKEPTSSKFWAVGSAKNYIITHWTRVDISTDFVSPTIDYKEKYEKCINVIERFDAGIIGLYDL